VINREFSEEFMSKLNKNLYSIFKESPDRSNKDIIQDKDKFISMLNANLDLLIRKQIYCSISFLAYLLSQFNSIFKRI